MDVKTILSPGDKFSSPQVRATRLRDSVVFLVHIILEEDSDDMKFDTDSRDFSNKSVARWLRVWTPLCTFELYSE